MIKLVSLIIFFSLAVFAASTNPKIDAVPTPGNTKINLARSLPADTSLIKTEKTIIDKNCKMIQGKMVCIPPSRHIKRKTIE
ncbi:MAG: hypothetical protein Q7U04_10400 [Bacteriovorax sp.]|nr:hypothetical protein [Bacteriovorax sp.]